ncbi:MAG TPA: helix-turn-helix transcriptional regulator [Pseudonocardiaceae bacterium]
MSDTVFQARQALGQRLRDIRNEAGLTGRDLAGLAGWHSSKISKIEYGKQAPTEDDIRVWCEHTGAQQQIPDLLATVRHLEAMYIEWRRMLAAGTRHRQRISVKLEAATTLMRWYEPHLVPGLLHTPDYATAILRKVIAFYNIPDDLEAGVATRMERQQILYRGDHRFHFILAQQALSTLVGDRGTMIGQLDRLLTVMTLPRVRLGIVPTWTSYEVPVNQFIMFDNRLVQIETISAELSITQPAEIALYNKAFTMLEQQAVYGKPARQLIDTALEVLQEEQRGSEGDA